MDMITFAKTFLHSQFFVTLPYPTSDFTGQTVIVTGSNTGLGFEAARHFVRLNAAKVILAVRTTSKGEAAAKEILRATQADPSRLEVWPLDLSSYDSVKAFGQRARSLGRLDAVSQNAGIFTGRWKVEEGMESHITVNVISPVLLGLLLLPKLKESAKTYGTTGRLAFVGSDLQYVAKFREKSTDVPLLKALNDEQKAEMGDRYMVSKLLLLYAVREMARLSPVTPDSPVIINYLTPGACISEIFRDDVSWFKKILMTFVNSIIARTTEAGSRTLLHAASPDVGVETHGKFLMDCEVRPNGPNVDGDEGRKLQEKFWKELVQKLEAIQPGVTRV